MIKLMKFGAPWCGPCKMLDPVLDELKEEMTDVKFVFVNVDEQPALAADYEIMSVPTMLIFKDDELKVQMAGFRPKEHIVESIENLK